MAQGRLVRIRRSGLIRRPRDFDWNFGICRRDYLFRRMQCKMPEFVGFGRACYFVYYPQKMARTNLFCFSIPTKARTANTGPETDQ